MILIIWIFISMNEKDIVELRYRLHKLEEKIDVLNKVEKYILIALIPISLFRLYIFILGLSIAELWVMIEKNKTQKEIDEYKNKLYENLEDFKIEVDDNLYKLYGNFASTDILEGEEYILNAKRDD